MVQILIYLLPLAKNGTHPRK